MTWNRLALAAGLAVALGLATPASAQTLDSLGLGGGGGGEGPIVIEADDALEWDQEGRRYIARGNAYAARGEASVRAQRLVAQYRDGANGIEIYRLSAVGGVVLTSGGATARGDEAIYDLDTQVAILTGDDLRLESEGDVLTAEERLEYRERENQALAIGNATVQREGNTLRAERLVAFFADSGAGERGLERVEARNGVRIDTPDEVITGEHGDYNATSRVATLTGSVRLCRPGAALVRGNRATVNLETGVSQLTGEGGRASAIFNAGEGGAVDPCTLD